MIKISNKNIYLQATRLIAQRFLDEISKLGTEEIESIYKEIEEILLKYDDSFLSHFILFKSKCLIIKDSIDIRFKINNILFEKIENDIKNVFLRKLLVILHNPLSNKNIETDFFMTEYFFEILKNLRDRVIIINLKIDNVIKIDENIYKKIQKLTKIFLLTRLNLKKDESKFLYLSIKGYYEKSESEETKKEFIKLKNEKIHPIPESDLEAKFKKAYFLYNLDLSINKLLTNK